MPRPPIPARALADVAEFLAYARQTSGPVIQYAGPIPLRALFACSQRDLMGVTRAELTKAVAEIKRRSTQPIAEVEPVAPPTAHAAEERSALLDSLHEAIGEGFTPEEATSLHEAAHACVAVALGVPVHEVSVRPRAGRDGSPGSLGHVVHSSPPDPLPIDAWANSFWVETSVMVELAGFVLGELLDGYCETSPRDQTDYQWAMAVLKTVEPDPTRTGAQLQRLRNKVAVFLLRPWLLSEIFELAGLLQEHERLTGHELHARLYGGRCAAVCPTDPSIRCDIDRPHARGPHQSIARRDAPIEWSGFAFKPSRTPPISTQTGPVKALRNLNNGGPQPLGKKWLALIETVVDEPLDLSGEPLPTAWCQSP